MSNEQRIIDKILAEAKAEEEDILKRAEAEADEIVRAASEKADKEYNAAMKISQGEAEKAAAKEISGAEMEAKKIILSRKQKALEEIIRGAQAKLSGLNDEEYRDVIKDMLGAVNIKNGEIIFSKKDKARLGDLLSEMKIKVSDETRNIGGGFIVKQGEVEFNYTFDSIIAVEREEIERIAAEILFR